MPINIDEKNLKQGILGLVIALVEIINEALKLQAYRRIEGGSLNDEEIERLGQALSELDETIDEIKVEHGIVESVQSVRDGLDDIVDGILDKLVHPERMLKVNPNTRQGPETPFD